MSSESGRWKLLAAVVEVEPAFLEQCVLCGALRPEELPEDGAGLSAAQLSRLRRLERLSQGLEIDVYAAAVIVDLLERVEALEARLDRTQGPARRP